MDVIIQSLGFKAGDKLEGYVKEKLGKLEHKSDKIVRAEVTLYKGSEGNPNNNYCEIRLEVPGNDHFTKKNAPEFEQAIVEAVDVLHRMLSEKKEKMVDRRQQPNAGTDILPELEG